jgi:hypothetical protein
MFASGRSSDLAHRLCRVHLLLLALILGVGAAAFAATDSPQSQTSSPPAKAPDANDSEPPEEPVSCAAVLCPVWTRCDESSGTARCIPFGPPCGGKADLACPGAGTCVDDPEDNCDPDRGRGKKNCPGICQCNAIGLCIEGYRWESSPFVCGCVPEEAVTCGPTLCPVGQVCCNASCGICTEPEGSCIQIACE